ncbi:MAG: universal stress protein [Desulfocapsaceae bacterium]|jgi:nucleotide-binding universal stress UspA family protein|nr:universal stress protein [Desulfocapsaceae bacterium]
MKEIENIVVPVDFLEHTDNLVDFAVNIAKKLDGKIRFIHVVENPYSFAEYSYPSMNIFQTELVEVAEERMKRLVEKNKNTCSGCEGKVITGNVVETILDFVKEVKGDLIIIGTHGRKGLEKMWLGSVAERVVRRSPCPALTCNPYR